jgi:hypothetical protein
MNATHTSIENSFARIAYDPRAQCIIFTYKRFGTSEEFRNSWLAAAELATQHNVHKWLSNSVRMEVLRPDDQDWFIQVMAPLLKTDSQKTAYMAIVVTESAFARLSVLNIAKAVKQNHGAVFKYFSTQDKGLEWLMSVKSEQ